MKPYNTLTFEEKLACISLYPKEAKRDNDPVIRLQAYRALGFTEEAKIYGFRFIRHEAELYFRVKNFNQQTIIIGGITYDRQEVENALKDIKKL